MSFETDFDSAFTILLGKAQGTLTVTPAPVTPTPVTATPTTRVVDVAFVIGARGTALAVNDHAFLRLGLNGVVTIVSWSLAGTVAGSSASGTVTVDVLTSSFFSGLSSICASNRPALTAQSERADQTPANWTTTIQDGQWIMAKVLSTGGTLEVVGLTLRCAVAS